MIEFRIFRPVIGFSIFTGNGSLDYVNETAL